MRADVALSLVLPLTFVLARPAGADVAPNENLVVDGLPPIPDAVAASAAPYADYRSAGLLTWHPQRRELLIATRFADTTQIHQVRFPGGARTQLTFFPDRIGGAEFPPDARRA